MNTGYSVGGVVYDRPFKIRRLGHMGIYVSDMDAALHFYRDLLGFTISDPLDLGPEIADDEKREALTSTVIYFTRHNTDHHSFVLFPRDMMNMLFGSPDWSVWSINQMSWQVGSLEEVTNAIDWLAKRGNDISRCGRDVPGSNWHVYPFDPDGHINELFCNMEQIGWNAQSKPVEVFEHGRQIDGQADLPQPSEADEIAAARERGVDLASGYRAAIDAQGQRYEVGGLLLPRPFKITGIGPIRLFVEDVTTSGEYYRDTLGLTVTEEIEYKGHRCVFLRVNTEHHSLALYPEKLCEELGLSPHTTLMSLGLRLGGYSQLRDAREFLEQHGVEIRYLPAELSPGIDYNAFAIDPEGHALQLYFQIEQIGWDGKPRPAAERRQTDPQEWPEIVQPSAETYAGEPFLGPFR
jgi:catechol 2,3-dioxygenase-like lactoylglutathione lyase family enzyme